MQSLHIAEKYVMLLKPLTLLKPLLSAVTGHGEMNQKSQRSMLIRVPLPLAEPSGALASSTSSSIYANNTV